LAAADFDGDQHLGREDLEQVIKAITRNAMTPDEIEYILTAVVVACFVVDLPFFCPDLFYIYLDDCIG